MRNDDVIGQSATLRVAVRQGIPAKLVKQPRIVTKRQRAYIDLNLARENASPRQADVCQ